MRGAPPLSVPSIRRSFNDERLYLAKKLGAIVRVNLHLDRFGQVERENAHDRLRVDGIAPGDEVNIEIVLRDGVDKAFHIVDGVEPDNH